jgi:hypothetical protein
MSGKLTFNKRNHIAAMRLLVKLSEIETFLTKDDVLQIIDEMKKITIEANY